MSYAALDASAAAIARSLRENGLVRGDRIALYLPNIYVFHASQFGRASLEHKEGWTW